MESALPSSLTRLREPAIALGLTVVAVIVAFLLPSAGAHSQSTPPSIIFGGLVQGMPTALTAAALVLVYRSARVINFAQLAIGVVGAIACFNFVYLVPWVPFPVAFLFGLLGGAAMGVVFQLIFGIRFARAPRLVLTLATLFVAAWLTQFGAGLAQGIPGFPDISSRTADQINGSLDIRPLLPFSGWHFQVGNLPLKYGFPEILTLVVAPVMLLGLAYFLARTRWGKAIRATAENSERAALLGISVTMLSLAVWAIAGMFSSASLILTGITGIPGSTYSPAPEILLAPIALAVLARMRSIFTAVMGSIAYGILYAALTFQQPDLVPIFDLVLFLVLSGGLIIGGQRLTRGAETSSWEATKEVRPVPREMARLPLVWLTKWVAIAIGLGAVLLYPFFVSAGDLTLGSAFMLSGIVVLSIIILTGWAGQASAGQFALVAVGAVAAAVLNSKLGLGFYIAVPVATVLTGALAALLAFPALRIQGLFLLASTYAFATMVRSNLFNEHFFPWVTISSIPRPTFFLVDFDDARSWYYLTVGALVLSTVIVVNLRRSRFGRLLIAVRDNEPNSRSAGVNPVRTRITAFAVAGALAGFAGGLFAFQERAIIPTSYEVGTSLQLLQVVVIGGAASILGGLSGLFLINGLTRAFVTVQGANEVIGLLPLLILYLSPGGLVAIFQNMRDAVFRIVAERRQMVVPSLFADIDPEALHLRLIPLADPLPAGGLQLVRERFHIAASRLFLRGAAGSRPLATRDAAALAAAGTESGPNGSLPEGGPA